MHIENMLARPFSRWDIVHGEGEPAYGYFARLVTNEGHTSMRVYLNEVGLNGRNLHPDELLAAVRRLPLSSETFEALDRWTPIRDGSLYRLGTETARLKQMSMSKRRWCRSCLCEARHHRVWWDFVAYLTCPKHSEALVDRTVGGETLRWYWPHFDVDPDGFDLADGAAPGTSTAGTGLESYIEGRLLGRQGLPFDDVALHHVIDACGMLENILPEEGFAALTMPEADLRVKLATRIRDKVPEDVRLRGIEASLGDVVSRSAAEEGSLRSWVKEQIIQAFADVGRIGRKRFARMDIEKRDFTLAEAATELGVNRKGLSRFAKQFDIGHTPWKDVHSFSKDDVEALRLKLADLITLPETRPITGVPGHEFRFLERAGFITSYQTIVAGSPAVRYLRTDVVALVDGMIASVSKEGSDDASVSSYARRTNQGLGSILEQVFKGQLAVVGLSADGTGLRRLQVALPKTVAKPGMTLGEAAKLTKLQQASISELVAMGVIERIEGSPRLSEASVREFHETYMNAALLGEQMGCGAGWVKARLKAMGAHFAFETKTNTIITRDEEKRLTETHIAKENDYPVAVNLAGN